MQQIISLGDSAMGEPTGLKKLNDWLREHQNAKVVGISTVPFGSNVSVYVVVDIPDKGDNTNE